MIAEFKTLEVKEVNGEKVAQEVTFRLDTGKLHWSIVGSIQDADGNRAEIEGGTLVPQPRNVYNLDGRQKSGGLMTVVFMPIFEDSTLTIVLQGNVPIKDFNLPEPLESIRAIVAPGRAIEKPTVALAQA